MTLPGDDDHVARAGVVERPADGDTAIGLDSHLGVLASVGDAAQYLLDDPHRVFVSRVVRGHERTVAPALGRLTHQRSLGPVTVATTPEDSQHPSVRHEPPRLVQDRLQPGWGVGVVDDHRERRDVTGCGARRRGRGDDLEATRDGCDAPHGPRNLLGLESELLQGQCRLRRQQRVVDVDGAGQRRRDPLASPGELGVAGAQHDVGGVAMVHGDHGDAGPIEEATAPGIIRMDDPAQRPARREQHGLRLEVVLHGVVIIQVIVTQVGEDGHVEVDALDPRLHERMARHLHGDRVAGAVPLLAVTHAGQEALDLGRLGCRTGARERAHHVRRPTRRAEEVTQDLGHRGLAIRPGDADHQEVPRRMVVERSGQTRHDWPHGPGRDSGLDDTVVEQLGNEVLAQEADRAALDRLAGIGVPVARQPGHATEEVAGNDPAAVVRDASHLHRGRVPDRLDHLDVVEEDVHGDGSHGRPDSVTCLGHPCVTAAMGVSRPFT